MGTVVICLPVLINRSPWAHVGVFPDLCVLLVLCYVWLRVPIKIIICIVSI